MRLVSLLPSLTELVCALGRRADLVGVTHECDYPVGIERLPHLTRTRIPTAATSAEIDALVSQQAGSLYELDEKLLISLRPDLILTQEQCDVCAVNEVSVRRAASRLPAKVTVESVNPTSLTDVHSMFRSVGVLRDRLEEAETIVASFEIDRPERVNLNAVRNGNVVVVDGSAFFSRPGPRLETSMRIVAAALDPDRHGDLAPPPGQGWRFWKSTR